jgi:N-acetylglucosamine-6-phosphate deacetylase
MNDGEIHARHYATGQPVALTWHQGVIRSVGSAVQAGDLDTWIAPALVDLQVNGFAGVDFQRDDLTAGDLLVAVRGLRAAGCTRFLLTLITDEWPKLMRRLARLRELRAGSTELQHTVSGWHLEGPFLSAEPGYCGAHDPGLMLDPTPNHLRELRAVTGTDPLLLTLAPERYGALEAIRLAVSLGLKVSLGHTNASAEALRAAVEAGATGFTHLGNACPQLLDRHDNILWRVLDTAELTVSLIPDGLHVAPALFRLFHRSLEPGRLIQVTDAMAAAGAPPGRYTLGSLELEVGADGVVRRPGQSHFVGSALRPIDGVMRSARMLGCSWRGVWDGLSSRPARRMGWSTGLETGAPADLCLLKLTPAGEVRELGVLVAGEQVA